MNAYHRLYAGNFLLFLSSYIPIAEQSLYGFPITSRTGFRVNITHLPIKGIKIFISITYKDYRTIRQFRWFPDNTPRGVLLEFWRTGNFFSHWVQKKCKLESVKTETEALKKALISVSLYP
jgi:hypothetical protein